MKTREIFFLAFNVLFIWVGSEKREKRQVYRISHFHPPPPRGNHFPSPYSGRSIKSYRIYPPYSPTAHFIPYSVFAAQAVNERPRTHSVSNFKATISPATLSLKQTFIHDSAKNPVHEGIQVTPSPIIHSHGTPTPPPGSYGSTPNVFPPVEVTPVPEVRHPYTSAPPPLVLHPQHVPISPSVGHFVSTASPLHGQLASYPPPPVEVSYSQTSCKEQTQCMPLVACPLAFDELLHNPYSTCKLYGDARGVCCPPAGYKKTGFQKKLFKQPFFEVDVRSFSTEELNDAARAGLWDLAERDILEKTLQERNIVVSDRRTAAYGHLQFFKTSPLAQKLGRDALTSTLTSNQLIRAFKLSREQASYGLQQFTTSGTIIDGTCPAQPRCGEKEKFYRTIDGSCNNLDNPSWGMARTPFQRIAPPVYADGLYAPRDSVTKSHLPSPRVVSISNVVDADLPDHDFTLSVMQWGQFIDHDLTHTPIFRFGNETGIECCNSKGGFVDPSFNHPACLPIEIPDDDPFYEKFGRRCMNFVRSMPAPRDRCSFGYTEQMNQITHFLDGSAVYGSSQDEEEDIRSFKGGLLRMHSRRLLPPDRTTPQEECDATHRGFHCFLAGDNRVNEQPGLAVIHTIWVREHNRLAKELYRLNPHWAEETIYQETRRLVVAQIQHIVYNEWLPLVLGKKFVEVNLLVPLRYGFIKDYDPKVNPSIFNEFATVAFRFGHTLVQGMLKLYAKGYQSSSMIQLHRHFNSPHLLYTPGKLDEFLRGLSTQSIQRFDNVVSAELTNRLFQKDDNLFGMDLVAMNIQRARDHGIPGYNELRYACGLTRAKKFEDFLDVIPPEVVATFKLLYPSVEDVDPFIAGISELPVEDAIVGPTFRCIIGDQFIRLKRGDRFFYENGNMPTSFTEAQLYEIRQTSWARILCDNGEYITYMQPLAMRTPVLITLRGCSSALQPYTQVVLTCRRGHLSHPTRKNGQKCKTKLSSS